MSLLKASRSPGVSVEGEKWVVESKRYSRMVEVSAVQENAFGRTSWGWPGIDKFVVMETRGFDGSPEDLKYLAAAEEAAQLIVDGFNAKLVK